MRLQYFSPSSPFRPWLTAFALADGVDAPSVENFPAMLPNLHIRLSGSSTYSLAGGRAQLAPRVTIIGPTASAYRIGLGMGLSVLAAGFLPAGFARFVGVPAGELADQIVDGADIWGHQAVDRLCDRLYAAKSIQDMTHVVEEFLLGSARNVEDYHRSPAFVLDHWLERSRDLSLDGLKSVLGYSDRHLRRIVYESHGASPKTLAVKYRALRAAASLAVQGSRGDDLDETLALYADQAHFIRDFKRFTGWTPQAFVREGGMNVAAFTMAGRRKAGVSRPLALWS